MAIESPASAGRVHVAAFGKHPGWDDHIEDIGLDCDAFVRAKRLLYTEGLAGNIDSGAWEKLADEQRLPGFGHVFYWRRSDGFIIGRMWSSRDGRGRTKYPMVVCAMIENAPWSWAISQVLPRLEAIESKCTQTNSAELVRFAIGEAKRGLEDQVALMAGGASSRSEDPAATLKRLLEHPDLSKPEEQGVGLLRVMYEVEREMAAFRSSAGGTRGATRMITESTAQHLRVPRCLGPDGEAARAWLTLVSQDVADSASVLILEPKGQDFLDVIVGDPKPAQLFCVKASAAGLAKTSDVPYSIDPTFKAAAETRITAWKSGKIRTPSSPTSAASSAAALASEVIASPKKSRALVIALLLLAVLLVVVLLIMRSGSPTPAPQNNDQASKTPSQTTPKPEPERAAAKPTQPEAAPPEQPKPAPVPSFADGDPRANWQIDAAVAAAKSRLDRLDRELAAEGATSDPTLRQRLDRANERVAKFVRTATLTSANRESIARDMKSVEQQVTEVQQEADVKLAQVGQRVAAFLEGVAKDPQVSSEPMRRAWAVGMRAIPSGEGWQTARERSAQLAASLKDAEQAVAGAARPDFPVLRDADAGAIDAAVRSRRDAALQAAADAVVAGESGKVRDVAAAFGGWGNLATGVMQSAASVERQLALGLGLTEAPPGGQSIEALAGGMKSSAAWKELGNALGPIDARVEALRGIGGQAAAGRLIEMLRESKADTTRVRATEVLSAWARLAEIHWPGTSEELARAATLLSEEVRPVIQRMTDEPGKAAAMAKADRTARAMWKNFMSEQGADPAALEAASKAAAALSVTDAEKAGLPSWSRYNLARFEFEAATTAAAAKTGAARADGQRAAIEAFYTAVNGLDVAKAGEPQALLAALETLRGKGAELDLGKLGPGAAGWKLVDASDSEVVTYTWAPRGTEQRVEFRRVASEDSGEVSYISTSEVSLGLFMDIASSDWTAFAEVLPKSEEGGLDPRPGPRVWRWAGEPAAGMVATSVSGPGDLSQGWVRIRTAMSTRPYYPEGMTVEPPGPEMPMQYVTPVAAVMATRKAGCRLPTSAEWRACNAANPTENPNLRDATWAREYEHVRQFSSANPEWPAGGVFWPQGAAGRVGAAQDASPAVTTDDGVLWFSRVTAGSGKFRHLVGNVSEFVFEDATAMDGVAPAKDKVEGILGKGEKLRVIGGSALSPGSMKVDEPQAVSVTGARGGYSDVGFRLAFSAPRAAGAAGAGERIKQALQSSGYVRAKDR